MISETGADACACQRCLAADLRPSAALVNGSANVAMVALAATPMVVHEVMDSIVGFDLAGAIEQFASIVVALTSIEVLAVPLRLVDYVAFYS